MLEKTFESPLECKEIQPVNPKGNQPRIFTGRIDAEAKAPILWPPDAKSQGEGITEDEMVGWHHQLNGHEFEQAPGGSGGQRSLACCSPRDHNKSDVVTEHW